MLEDIQKIDRWVNDARNERKHMIPCLKELPMVKHVYPSSANFLLVKVDNAAAVYAYLVDKGIIVRNRSNITLCENALRITIGSKSENNELLGALRTYNASSK